jgi:hypothetical protein
MFSPDFAFSKRNVEADSAALYTAKGPMSSQNRHFILQCFYWFSLRYCFLWCSFLIVIWLCKANIIPNYNQQNATFPDLFISTDTLHVSGGSSAHHQEHITVHTASGIVNHYCCLLLSWMRSMLAAAVVFNTWSCMYSYVLLMMSGGTAWNM